MAIISLYAVLFVIVGVSGALVGSLFLKQAATSVLGHSASGITATDTPMETKMQIAVVGSALALFAMGFTGAATIGFAHGSWHAFFLRSVCGVPAHYLLGTLLLVLSGAFVQTAFQPRAVRKRFAPILRHFLVGKTETPCVLAQASLFFLGAFVGEIGAIVYYSTPTG